MQLLLEELVKLRQDTIAIFGMQALNPKFVGGPLVERIIAQPLKAVGPIHIAVGYVPIPDASRDYLFGDPQPLFISQQLLLSEFTNLGFVRGLQNSVAPDFT